VNDVIFSNNNVTIHDEKSDIFDNKKINDGIQKSFSTEINQIPNDKGID
jgi:hypothetical protein